MVQGQHTSWAHYLNWETRFGILVFSKQKGSHFFPLHFYFCHKAFSTKHRISFLQRKNDWETSWPLASWSCSFLVSPEARRHVGLWSSTGGVLPGTDPIFKIFHWKEKSVCCRQITKYWNFLKNRHVKKSKPTLQRPAGEPGWVASLGARERWLSWRYLSCSTPKTTKKWNHSTILSHFHFRTKKTPTATTAGPASVQKANERMDDLTFSNRRVLKCCVQNKTWVNRFIF